MPLVIIVSASAGVGIYVSGGRGHLPVKSNILVLLGVSPRRVISARSISIDPLYLHGSLIDATGPPVPIGFDGRPKMSISHQKDTQFVQPSGAGKQDSGFVGKHIVVSR
jgi:hypothetical protein